MNFQGGPRTKSDFVADYLRDALLRGAIRPGEPISIGELATELGVSATPVREALKTLQAQGLIEQSPHRTGAAARLSLTDIEELYLLRVRLESLATALAVERGPQSLVATLNGLHERMVDAVQRSEHEAASALNADWHFAIYSSADTRWLNEFIVRLWVGIPWNQLWRVSGRESQSIRQHALVMSAIESGNAEEAESAMAVHIRSGKQSLLHYMTESER